MQENRAKDEDAKRKKTSDRDRANTRAAAFRCIPREMPLRLLRGSGCPEKTDVRHQRENRSCPSKEKIYWERALLFSV